MAECLNRFARCREIVPVETLKKGDVEGWLFRDRNNRLIFVPSAEMLKFEPES